MKRIIYIFATAATLITTTACGDFLEPNSTSEFVPKDAVSLNELLLGEAYQRNDMDGFNILGCHANAARYLLASKPSVGV